MYAAYLARYGSTGAAAAFVRRFVTEIRRERYAPHRDLLAILALDASPVDPVSAGAR